MGIPGNGSEATWGIARSTAGTNDGLMLPKSYTAGTKRLCVYHHGAGELAYSPFYNTLSQSIAAIYPHASSDEGTTPGTNTDAWGNATAMTGFTNLATTWQSLYGKTGKVFRYGVSMGGASALCYAAHNPTTTAAVVSTVPAMSLGQLWSPTTTVAAASNGGTITAIASWAFPSAGVLAIADGKGILAPLSGTTTPYPAPATVVTSGGTASITYTGVSGNTLTGCVFVSGSGTVATGAVVTYSRIAGQAVASGNFTTSINSAYGGTYNPATTDATYNGTTVNGVTFTTQQSARDVYYMGINTPQLFSTFPIYLWYGQQDPTCCWKEIEAWATSVNNYCIANSLPQTVTLVADPAGTHATTTYDCWYSYGTKLGGSGGTTVTVPYANVNSVLSTFNGLN